MPLTDCPECGKKGVSDTAAACPNCGFNIKDYFYQKKREKEQAEAKKERDAENLSISQGICPKCKNKLSEVTYFERQKDWGGFTRGYSERKLTYCPNCRWENDITTRYDARPYDGAIIDKPDINTLAKPSEILSLWRNPKIR